MKSRLSAHRPSAAAKLCLALGCGLLLIHAGGCRARQPLKETVHPQSEVRFEEVGKRAGLDFQWPKLGRPLTIRSSFGHGCGFFDYDQDGAPDILLIAQPKCVLYRNLRNGSFKDVSAATGLDQFTGEWHGCATGDYDGDGWTDLYLTGFHQGHLLRNQRGGSFADASVALGSMKHAWESSAGFADLDGDGDLDLFIGNYVRFGPHSPRYCELTPGVKSACPPSRYPAAPARLLRNDGGRFTDVSSAAGIATGHGKNLAVGFLDYDRDGKLDIYVANDGVPADLFRNLGNWKFKNAGFQTGCALAGDGRTQAGMGVACADYNHDGWQDLIVTTFSSEEYSLYRNGGGYFEAVSGSSGIAGATRNTLGFGVQWLDFQNDEYPDLFFGNGHVYDNAAQVQPGTTFRQRPGLLLNRQGRWFEEVGHRAGAALAEPLVARGLAKADYDGDGRVDVLCTDLEGRPRLFRNITTSNNHWLTVRLVGPRGNPRGEGAVIVLMTAKGERHVSLSSSGSYLSTNDPAAHFGLGATEAPLQAEVRWPDGRLQHVSIPEVDREVYIRYSAPGEQRQE